MEALHFVSKMGSAVSLRLVVNEIRKGDNLGGEGAKFLVRNENMRNFCFYYANYFIFSQKQDKTKKIFF